MDIFNSQFNSIQSNSNLSVAELSSVPIYRDSTLILNFKCRDSRNVVRFICKDSPYVVHLKRRDSTYIVHLKRRDCTNIVQFSEFFLICERSLLSLAGWIHPSLLKNDDTVAVGPLV